MAELGATADAQTPSLRDLNASAGQLATLPRATSARSRSRAASTCASLAETADKARPGDRVRQADRRRAHQDDRARARARQQPRDRPQGPRRPQPRGREGPALAGRPGLHGLRGGPPIRLRPDAGHQHLRRERPHAQGQPLRSECSDYQNADSAQAQGAAGARASSAAASPILGPNQPGVTTADPTDTGVDDAGAPSPPSSKKQTKSKSKKDKDKDKSKNAPGQPDLQEGAREAAQGRRRREQAVRAVAAEREGPERPAARTSRRRRSPASRTARAGSPRRRIPRPSSTTCCAHERPRRILRFANPVLVGAVTVLVVIVAVFLSYNANQGLPFVPTTTLKVRVANGAEPRQGQRDPLRRLPHRRGRRHEAGPARRTARPAPSSTLKLDKTIGKVPEDSRWRIRPRSALGLKYLELDEGHSKTAFEDGDTVPLEQTDDNDRPRRGLQDVRRQDARRQPGEPARLRRLVRRPRHRRRAHGRGGCRACSQHLEPVAANLADPDTELPRFFKELGDAARIVAPDLEAATPHLFTTMADTCEARRARPGGAASRRSPSSPPTMDAAIESFRVQRPFLAELTTFSKDFSRRDRGAARRAAGHSTAALETGTRVQQQACPQLNERARGRRSTRSTTSPRRRRRNAAHPRRSPRRSPRSTRSCASTARS